MRRVAATLTALLVAVTGLAACTSESAPDAAVRAFLDGWKRGSMDGVAMVDAEGEAVAVDAVEAQIKALSGNLSSTVAFTRGGDTAIADDQATAPVDVNWTVVAGVPWKYRTSVRLTKQGDDWKVLWSPATIHPDLKEGDVLSARRIGAARGEILDGAGQAIVKGRPVVRVGIEPRKVNNQAALVRDLGDAFASVGVDVSLDDLPDRIDAAKPDAFVDVVTLRREVYDQIRNLIHPLAGTVFVEDTLQLAPTRAFARALIGTVGEVLKEQMDKRPGVYLVGDQVGQSGLQEQYDDLLRGTPGVRVVIAGRGIAGSPEPELFTSQPAAGKPLRTTLDQRVQKAADAALSRQRRRAAVVAVRISDGALLAVANGPDGGEVNLALTAAVPPGSTFKMVSALGLLDADAVKLDTPVNCPKTFTVEGRTFSNANNFVLGNVPFRVDFAKSCNTAFASQAPKLGPDGLTRAAASVGIGTSWNLGTEVFTGSVPAGASAVDAAAAAFGQGKTQVSPVALAAAAAAVSRGSWKQPKLFAELPPGAPAMPPGPVTEEGKALKSDSVSALRTMMREVVTSGTATALRDVPGDPVHAKTGTAEFDDNPAHTHAWTIGFQGDIAFAVFVENGGSSGTTAVPIVESFLRGL
jgi:cell division protein FtsI/penicillin-binding protein 2